MKTRNMMIQELKKRFQLNNPVSWSKLSDKKIKEYYQEFIGVGK